MSNSTHRALGAANVQIVRAQTMTSREIADLCDKRHDNVMADCRKLADFYSATYSPEKSGELVESSTYVDSTGRNLPCFALDKQACLDLVTGYSLPHRHAVNKRWQELEEIVNQPKVPQTMPEALRLAAEVLEQRDQLALVNQAQAVALAEAEPKVQALNRFSNHDGKHNLRNAAKVLGVQESKLKSWLLAHRWYYRDHGGRLCAYADKIASLHLDTVSVELQRSEGIQVVQQPVITQKGLVRLAELLARDGLLPRSAA